MYKYFRKESYNAKFKLCTSPTETNGPVNPACNDRIDLLDACNCDGVSTTAVDKFLVTTFGLTAEDVVVGQHLLQER